MVGAAMWDAVIPEGPLHPGHAIAAFAAGVIVGLLMRRRPVAWTVSVAVTAVLVQLARRDGELLDAISDHPRRLFAVAAGAGAGLVVAGLRLHTWSVIAASGAALAMVWGIVPDTETPLIYGGVVAGGAACLPRLGRTRVVALLAALPVIAAMVGSIGRPERLELALSAAGLAAAGVAAVVEAGIRCAQRAGTPTTVTPGGTSSMTTAPAPTTAS